MSVEKVREHLRKYGLEERILEFDESSATVELAARALGCEPELIAKTLSFRIGDRCILIVMAGDAKIDNRKYKEKFGTKAKMLSYDETEREIGHAVGGVCPFGVNAGTEVYLDESLKRHEVIYPAAGSSNSAVRLCLPELERASEYKEWIDVSK